MNLLVFHKVTKVFWNGSTVDTSVGIDVSIEKSIEASKTRVDKIKS